MSTIHGKPEKSEIVRRLLESSHNYHYLTIVI